MKEAILLLNMGGPNNLNEVRLFLKNMFNDPRIISAPAPIRKMIAWWIIRSREEEATENYRRLGGKSPIIGYTQKLVEKLQKATGIPVFFAMRYTPPFTEEVLKKLKSCERIYAIPLYPHHSVTTTESSFDALFEAAEKIGIQEKIRTIDHYHLDRSYNAAVIDRIKEALANEKAQQFELIFSAHGLPQKVIEKGDLYQKQIEAQVAYLKKALEEAGLDFAAVHLAYQSRVGPMAWTKPYLDETLKTLSGKRVLLYPISFTIDNSETEFELDIEYREIAKTLGIESYIVAKAPNDHPRFVEALKGIWEGLRGT
ncbi:MAG: ferrochelatase [Campylobacteraceae bacterium 4484_4]|nr:MAG: ferrochelatase [Campylobacteraceae bacterium 4484_4]